MLTLMLTGCNNPAKLSEDVLFSNPNWCVVKLNDSIVLCMPNNKNSTPIVINTYNSDYRCEKDNHVKLD